MLLPFYSEILNQEVKAGHEYVFLIYPKQYQYFWISQQDCRAQGKTIKVWFHLLFKYGNFKIKKCPKYFILDSEIY